MGAFDGRIVSVTPSVLRIETQIGVISVLSNTACLQPFSLTVSAIRPFTETDLHEGQLIRFEEEKMSFEESELIYDVSQATDIELSVDVMKSLFLPLDLSLRLRHLIRVIDSGSGVHPLSALADGGRMDNDCETVSANLPKLHKAVYEQDVELCREAGALLAGYGSGTTPDSDDVLEGYFAGYAALSMALGRSRERVLSITRAIAQGAAEQTNDISGALLLQAGEGLVSEDLFGLLQSLFSDAPYRAIAADASRVAKSVAPSGINVLTGVWLAVANQYIPARNI